MSEITTGDTIRAHGVPEGETKYDVEVLHIQPCEGGHGTEPGSDHRGRTPRMSEYDRDRCEAYRQAAGGTEVLIQCLNSYNRHTEIADHLYKMCDECEKAVEQNGHGLLVVIAKGVG